jgi:hypothetical protein
MYYYYHHYRYYYYSLGLYHKWKSILEQSTVTPQNLIGL